MLDGRAELNMITGEQMSEIGPFAVGEGYGEVARTIVHEEMHLRLWNRGDFRLADKVHPHIDRVVERIHRS